MAADQRFRPRERLQRKRDFEHVFAAKCSQADRVLVVYATQNELTWTRLGIITSKRVGNAVRRNHARRRIREAFRKLKSELPRGFDIICIARAVAADPDVDVAESLQSLTVKAVETTAKRAAGSKPQPKAR